MNQELFLFSLPNGKTFKIVDKGKTGLEIWRRQINGEYVHVETSPDMNCVKIYLKSCGYRGH